MTTWALDLDGVLWTGSTAVPGSANAVNELVCAGHEIVFVTNNAADTIDAQEAKLGDFGVNAKGRVINAAVAGAQLVEPGERVYVLGGPGIVEAVHSRGAVVLDRYEPGVRCDAVVVGLDRALTYERLTHAVLAINNGARFIATNTDSSFPHELGLLPGGGALVAAVQTATGVQPTIGGKPHRPMADLVRARFGEEGIMVGDRPETDGLFALALGYKFALVYSGVTSPADQPTDPAADLLANDLAELVSNFLRATRQNC